MISFVYMYIIFFSFRARAAIIARNLIILTQGASIGELTSLDELVGFPNLRVLQKMLEIS